tara:strand:+ start:42 stop:491 length:450 start_codon:yes stop_codon:yes gene_type:complete
MDPITLAALLGGTAGGAALRVGGSRALGAGVGGLGSYLGAKSVSGRDDNKQVKDEFDTKVQKELTRAYKLYENGEMTNEEFKYIEASFDELRNQKENLIKNNATFGVGLTTQEGIERGEPKYKLMVMQDKNPFTKDLPSGDTMNVGDFG